MDNLLFKIKLQTLDKYTNKKYINYIESYHKKEKNYLNTCF
jgi:hypothetical protein